MRLISGTQWNPAYTRLVLAEPERLEAKLDAVLEVGSWTEDEKEGMLWLCKLLKNERLEVRIALRLSGDGDGYFHNKHGILTDAAGDQIAFEGSLNETRSGWELNSESIRLSCSWWEMSPAEREGFDEIPERTSNPMEIPGIGMERPTAGSFVGDSLPINGECFPLSFGTGGAQIRPPVFL